MEEEITLSLSVKAFVWEKKPDTKNRHIQLFTYEFCMTQGVEHQRNKLLHAFLCLGFAELWLEQGVQKPRSGGLVSQSNCFSKRHTQAASRAHILGACTVSYSQAIIACFLAWHIPWNISTEKHMPAPQICTQLRRVLSLDKAAPLHAEGVVSIWHF